MNVNEAVIKRSKEPFGVLSFNDDSSFFELYRYAKENRMCIQPGCTTCCCGMFRALLSCLGADRISKMLKNSAPQEMPDDIYLEWHDALEILFVDFSRSLFEECYITREYEYVWTQYRSLRAGKLSPHEARKRINESLKKRAEILGAVKQ